MTDTQPDIFDSKGRLTPLSPDVIASLSDDRKKRYADVAAATLANTAADDEIADARKALKAAEKAMVDAGANMLRLSPKVEFIDALRAAQAAYRNSR
jgi:hypothetical protein